jgi:hypothetical protein
MQGEWPRKFRGVHHGKAHVDGGQSTVRSSHSTVLCSYVIVHLQPKSGFPDRVLWINPGFLVLSLNMVPITMMNVQNNTHLSSNRNSTCMH